MTKKERSNFINKISREEINGIIKIDLDEDEDNKKIEIDKDDIFIPNNKNEIELRKEIEEIKKNINFLTETIHGLHDFILDKLSEIENRDILDYINEEINKAFEIKSKEIEESILKNIRDNNNIKIKDEKDINIKRIIEEEEEEDYNKDKIKINTRIIKPLNFLFKSLDREEIEKLYNNIDKKKQTDKLILVERDLKEGKDYYLLGKFYQQSRIDVTLFKTIKIIEVRKNYDSMYDKYIKGNKILKEKK